MKSLVVFLAVCAAIIMFNGCRDDYWSGSRKKSKHTSTNINSQWSIVERVKDNDTTIFLTPNTPNLSCIKGTYFITNTYTNTSTKRQQVFASLCMYFDPKPDIHLSFTDGYDYTKWYTYRIMVIPNNNKKVQNVHWYGGGFGYQPKFSRVSSQALHNLMINNEYIRFLVFQYDTFETPTTTDTLITAFEFKLNCMGYTDAFKQKISNRIWY